MAGRVRRNAWRMLAVTTAVVLAGTGCARTGGGGDAAAEDGGIVHVACGATEEWCAAMTAQFTKSTGVKADFVRLSSGETLARIKAGKDNPEFDVWSGGPADGHSAAAAEQLLEPYVSPNAAGIPAQYKDPANMWTGVYIGALGFCSNTTLLREHGVEAPDSWTDLLDPKLAKSIGLSHPSTSGTAYTVLWTQVLLGGSEDKGLEYMRKLHPNVLQYSKSGVAPAQMTARGEIAVGLVFSHDCVATKEAGFPDLTVSFPSEGTGYEVGGISIVKGAKNPTSARKYVDWALTTEAQEIGPTVKSYQLPTNPDAKPSDKVVKLADLTLVNYDPVAAGKAKSALTKRFDAEVAQAPKS